MASCDARFVAEKQWSSARLSVWPVDTQPGIDKPLTTCHPVNCFVASLASGHVTAPTGYLAYVWHTTVLALGGNTLAFIVYPLAQLQRQVDCAWGQWEVGPQPTILMLSLCSVPPADKVITCEQKHWRRVWLNYKNLSPVGEEVGVLGVGCSVASSLCIKGNIISISCLHNSWLAHPRVLSCAVCFPLVMYWI